MKEKKKKWKKSDVASNQGQSLNLIRFGQTKFFCFTDKGNTRHIALALLVRPRQPALGRMNGIVSFPISVGGVGRRRCCKDAPTSE